MPAYRIAVIGMGLAVALGLTLWLRFSRLGLFVRAASTDPTTTAMQGVNTDALSAMVAVTEKRDTARRGSTTAAGRPTGFRCR